MEAFGFGVHWGCFPMMRRRTVKRCQRA